MSEARVVKQTDCPRTRSSLAEDLQLLGLAAGMNVIVHSSLASLGWVSGGAVAVIHALMDVVTPRGTLMMPSHSGDYSEPSLWGNPPVPEDWYGIIRETMPAFEPAITPTRGMGIIAETFRTWPGVLRSSHPASSFAAWGKNAALVTANHSLDFPMGDNSPLSKLYDLDGFVLLLGVGFDNNTSFHLAEHRSGQLPLRLEGAPILQGGKRAWATYQDIEYETDWFPQIGRDFISSGAVRQGLVGSGQAKLFSQPRAVDFALEWILQQPEVQDER